MMSTIFLIENFHLFLFIKTYCEMSSAGGGWTLVATINDNDVTKKCTLDDAWFSNNEISIDEPYSKTQFKQLFNWGLIL